MRIALVDDEKSCLEEMTEICRDFGQKNHCQTEIFTFSDGKSFLNAQNGNGFSVVFMDIYMDGMDGIAAALKMREGAPGSILVFLTCSTEFMPDAFSCHAFEYILKPLSPERIQKVLADAMHVLPSSHKYIEIAINRKTVPVFLSDIVSVTTDAHYLNLSVNDGQMLRSRMTMAEFMEQAGGDPRFLSINKGVICNADYILDFKDNCCILENGTRFPLRVRDRLKIEQAAQDYHFETIRRRQRRRKEEDR